MQMQAWMSQMLAEPRKSYENVQTNVAARNLMEMRRQVWLYQMYMKMHIQAWLYEEIIM
jgi:hypothetical protein